MRPVFDYSVVGLNEINFLKSVNAKMQRFKNQRRAFGKDGEKNVQKTQKKDRVENKINKSATQY
jgi:hypothetical protein